MTKPDSWTTERIALLGMVSDNAIAKRFGLPKADVSSQRRKLGIQRYRPFPWGETDLALLRSYTDEEIAKMTSRPIQEVAAKRKSL